MASAVLVVDFGTSTTSAAVVVGGQIHVVKEPATGAESWPSVVCHDGAELLVGSLAEGSKRARPHGYRSEIKRLLGESDPVLLGAAALTPIDLVTAVLTAVSQAAVAVAGGDIDRAVLTVPASYGPHEPRWQAMLTAAAAADYPDVELLPEPVAAALAPLAGEPLPVGSTVLVYDFGGGTFDTAVVRLTESGHDVVGHAALDDCGGHDLDVLLYQAVLDQAPANLVRLLEPTDDTALQVSMALTDFTRQNKHQLSERLVIDDFFTPALTAVQMKRQTVEEAAAPLLARTIECCRALLTQVDVEVDAVVLVGGATRMPVVAATVTEAFGDRIRRAVDPVTAVVRGAAVHAGRAGDRVVAPAAADPSTQPLRWELPAGSATFLRWLVEPGEAYHPATPLARVRLGSGEVWELRSDAAGVLRRQHAGPGDEVYAGDWLATVSQVSGGLFWPAEVVTTIDGDVEWQAFADAGRVLVRFADATLTTLDAATGETLHRRTDCKLQARGHGDRWYIVGGVAYDAATGAEQAVASAYGGVPNGYAIDDDYAYWTRRRPYKRRKSDLGIHDLRTGTVRTYEGYLYQDPIAVVDGVNHLYAYNESGTTYTRLVSHDGRSKSSTADRGWDKRAVYHRQTGASAADDILQTGRRSHRIPGRAGRHGVGAFSPDGTLLAARAPGDDTTLALISVGDGSAVTRVTGPGPLGPVAFQADGSLVATVGSTIVRWRRVDQ